MNKPPAEKINALLPQTQCEECGFKGCKPYAEAIAAGDANINLCPPGGTKTLHALSNLLQIDPLPYEQELQDKYRAPSVAAIEEDLCIGCVKCINACPVDAIIGSAKLMHTVITDLCTGCELCVEPCPMDCISMQSIPERSDEQQQQKSIQWRKQYEFHLFRLERDKKQVKQQNIKTQKIKRNAIAEAIARAKAKRRQFNE